MQVSYGLRLVVEELEVEGLPLKVPGVGFRQLTVEAVRLNLRLATAATQTRAGSLLLLLIKPYNRYVIIYIYIHTYTYISSMHIIYSLRSCGPCLTCIALSGPALSRSLMVNLRDLALTRIATRIRNGLACGLMVQH